jgi:hypothetical protein
MAGYQFIHLEVYSRVAPKKGRGKTTVRGVIAEAVREPEACGHVADPEPPVYLIGDEATLRGLESEIDAIAPSIKDTRGHKLRKDAAVLLAGVASFPPDGPEDYDRWIELTVEFLKEEHGDNLRCVIEHLDEKEKHLHFFALAPDLNAKSMHPGFAASAGIQDRAESMQAYKAAMRQYQDRFYSQVGAPCGLTRLGPGRQRLGRAEWRARQAEAEAASRTMVAAQLMSAEAKATQVRVAAEADGLRASARQSAVVTVGKAEAEAEALAARIKAEAEAEADTTRKAAAITAAEIKGKAEADAKVTRHGEKETAAARVADLRQRQAVAGRDLAARRQYGDPVTATKFVVSGRVYEPAAEIVSAIRAYPGPGVYDRAETRLWKAEDATKVAKADLSAAKSKTALAGPLSWWWHKWGEAGPRKQHKVAEDAESMARSELEALRSAAAASPEVTRLRECISSLRARAFAEMAGLKAEVETIGQQIDGLERIHELGAHSPDAKAARSQQEAEAINRREAEAASRKAKALKDAARAKAQKPAQVRQQGPKYMPIPGMP